MDYSPTSEPDHMSNSSNSGVQTPPSVSPHEGCQVCGATMNIRKNFGVPTCVSCRIFYSRNLVKDLKCYQNGHCRIEGPSRKSCAYCRFQKCLRAGMHKTHERRHRVYKRQHSFKHDKGISGHRENIMTFESILKDCIPMTNIQRASDEMSRNAPVSPSSEATISLFQDCVELSEMFRKPFTPVGNSVLQPGFEDTKTALSILEAVMKRVLSVVRRLPHFNEINSEMVSAMISEKICGLTAIMNSLNYSSEQDKVCLNLKNAGSQGLMAQPLYRLTESIFADLLISPESSCRDTTGVMTEMELVSLVKSMRRFFCFSTETFKELRHIGVILMAGIYFFTPDYKFTVVNVEHMQACQATYLNALRTLLKSWSPKGDHFMNTYTEVLLQFTEVKAIEFYYNMLARNVTIDSSSPVLLD